jgi:hypothetical protein
MSQLPLDVVDLLEMAAVHRAGEGPLFSGDLEEASALYQVHPDLLEHARVCLGSATARREAAEVLAQARRMTTCDNTLEAAHRVFTTLSDVPTLIADAISVPHGLELLTREAPEMASVLLGAHAVVVAEARQRLAARPSDEDDHDCPMAHATGYFSCRGHHY